MRSPRIKRALLSVSDKMGLADFARGLAAAGVKLYASGGTRRHLTNEGVASVEIADYTGFPEMLEGRIKTLHPNIHAGILCRHDQPTDMQAIDEHGVVSFELVVVNLYPFEATIARGETTWDEAIEQIDIGGPTLVRGAAKNHRFVTLATSAEQYAEILEAVRTGGATTAELRRRLAAAAFEHTARYDRAIADYFARETEGEEFPAVLSVPLTRKASLRYGENPHQQAALYVASPNEGANLATGRQLNGKELSYNNLLDLDSALTMARSLTTSAAAVVIKHNNPCGAAQGARLAEAARKALDGDPVSAFGSVLGFNRPLDAATAEVLVEPGRFIEAITAPSFEPEAVTILTTRPKWKANVRLIEVGEFDQAPPARDFRRIQGGFLVQNADDQPDDEGEWRVATERAPTDEELANLRFAWTMVRHVKSNAIVLVRERSLVGVGAGQMSRVDSVEIAIRKAGERSAGSVLGSDAFFPFADSIEQAAAAGVTAIIQPGGSRNDADVLAAANQRGLTMILTGRRHFKH